MQKTIVSDTSCLILLEKIGELEVLQQIYTEITITSVVALEFGSNLPEWIKIEDPTKESYEKVTESRLDLGEITAIALALDLPDCLLIIDDIKGRTVAEGFGIHVTGTLGVLIDAKLAGLINSIKPILEKIKETDFRLSDEIILLAKNRAGEE